MDALEHHPRELAAFSCECGAVTEGGCRCFECCTDARITRAGGDRYNALHRVLSHVGAAVCGTGGGHDAWTFHHAGRWWLVTNDDGFVPAVGDDIVCGLYLDDEWRFLEDSHEWPWDAAAAALADLLSRV